jgi:hypothetical protein
VGDAAGDVAGGVVGDADGAGAGAVVETADYSGGPLECTVRARVGRCGMSVKRHGGTSLSVGTGAGSDAGVLKSRSRKGKAASSKTTCRDVMTRPVLML